jgi:CheY-like chemotaxis protein
MITKHRSSMILLEIREIRKQLSMINDSVSSLFPSSLPNPELNIYYSFSSNTNIERQVTDYSPSTTSTTTTATAESTTIPIANSNNKRILIVDDEKDIAAFFKLALENAGFIVNVFNDPIKALSNYKAGVYDLLLLDIRMPQMNGFELYNKIKQIDGRVKVCFVTEFEDYYDEFIKIYSDLHEKGCFIRKPIGVDDLIRIVKSQLNYN